MGNMWLAAAAALCVVSMCKVTMCRYAEKDWSRDECKELKCDSFNAFATDKERDLCKELKCNSFKAFATGKEQDLCKELKCDSPNALTTGKEADMCKDLKCEEKKEQDECKGLKCEEKKAMTMGREPGLCKDLKCEETKALTTTAREQDVCKDLKCEGKKALTTAVREQDVCKDLKCEEKKASATAVREQDVCKDPKCEALRAPDGLPSSWNRPRLIGDGKLVVQRVSRHETSPAENAAMQQAWQDMQTEIETRSGSYEGQQEFEMEAFLNGRRARIDAGYCLSEAEACKSGNRIDAATLLEDFKDLWEQTNERLEGDILDQNSVFAKSGHLQFFTQVANKVQPKESGLVRLTASELQKAQANSTSSPKLIPEGEVFVQRVSLHELTPSEREAMLRAWELVRIDAKTEGKKVFEGKHFDNGSRARIEAGYCLVEVAGCKSGNRIEAAKVITDLENLWNRTSTNEEFDILEQNSVFMQSGPVQIFTQVARKVEAVDSHHT